MARHRTIKPEFCTSEQVVACSREARLLFALMWMFCDDGGVHKASAGNLRMEVFPGDEDITSGHVARWMSELIRADLVEEYEVDGQRYWRVTGWHHQKIDQPRYSYPQPDGVVPDSPKRRGSPVKGEDGRVFAERSARVQSRAEQSRAEQQRAEQLPPNPHVGLDAAERQAVGGGYVGELSWEMGTSMGTPWVKSLLDKGFTVDEIRHAIDTHNAKPDPLPIRSTIANYLAGVIRRNRDVAANSGTTGELPERTSRRETASQKAARFEALRQQEKVRATR